MIRSLILGFAGACAAAGAAAAPATPRTDASPHPLAGTIIDVGAERALPGPSALAVSLAEADVAVLGETHDNAEHHAAQAWLVAAMGASGLAFEMIPPEAEAALARLRGEGADRETLAAALDWAASGWPDFALYAPILEAAPAAPVAGGAVARETLSQAATGGAAAAAPPLARFGLQTPLAPEAAEAAAAEQVAAHCDAIPLEAARSMVEAQRLRDAAFAEAASRALDAAGRGPVALIAGRGHARRDRGVPAALAAARPELESLSVALLETDEAEDWRAYAYDAAGEPLYDYVWFFAPAEREDPCLAFLDRSKP